MRQFRFRAAFMRGGTSNAIMFRTEDLPADQALWPDIFRAAIGAPDPNGRQLDGMGGGISSLSKVCVIGPPSRPDADVDYTFFQIGVKDDTVDTSGNCGNMSSAVGPFAVDEGMVAASGSEGVVRIHNTNTRKIIVARFPLDEGAAAVDGDFALPGVAGTGAPVRLEFLAPGGASTGRLLPTGRPVDRLDVPGVGAIDVSMVDAANACCLVRASDLGVDGRTMPDALDTDTALLEKLEAIRRAAGVAMGIAPDLAAAAKIRSIPKVGIVSPPAAARTLSGEALPADDMDFAVRMVSVGQPHRAVPLTGAMCLAVASRIAGTLVHEACRTPAGPDAPIRIAQPSGLTVVGAQVRVDGGAWVADHATVYRTTRRLFDGFVYVSAARVPGLAETARAKAAAE